MRQYYRIAFGFLIGLAAMAPSAQAQWYYPSGYGGYGFGGWGADPASGYMAGLGAYARGQGVYEVEDAKAQAINADTMIKWNKALRARQQALRKEQRQDDARRGAERDERVARAELLDGTTLNALMARIYDQDPNVSKSSRADAPISPAAIREIPFEWDTEAITVCLNELLAKDSLPPNLMDASYAPERDALHQAVEAAIKEDAKGNVSPKTRAQLNTAIENFRAKFVKNTADFDPGYSDSVTYFTTLASLSRLLNDPSMKKILTDIKEGKERTVGELIAFMQSYNLRFGPATSDRQMQLYANLAPTLARIADAAGGPPAPPAPGITDKSGEGLRSAAKNVFKNMRWEQLQAHARDSQ